MRIVVVGALVFLAAPALAQAPDEGVGQAEAGGPVSPPPAAASPDDGASPAAALVPPQDPFAPDELAPLRSSSARELVAGDVIDGWLITEVRSPAHLPDGRPTEEACGWLRDVSVLSVAEQLSASPTPDATTPAAGTPPAVTPPAATPPEEAAPEPTPAVPTPAVPTPTPAEPSKPEPQPATFEVPCLQSDSGLVPGQPRIVVVSGPLVASDEHTDKADDAPTDGLPPIGTVPFLPHDLADVDQPPRLIAGKDGYMAVNKHKGDLLVGRVSLSLSIDRYGRVVRARSAGADLSPLASEEEQAAARKRSAFEDALVAEAIAKAQTFRFEPAQKQAAPVDVVLPFDIRFTEGVPPPGGPVDLSSTWFTIDGPAEKGELSSLGSIQLKNPQNSVGVGFGGAFIDRTVYAAVRPNLDLHYGPFAIGLGSTLRFQVFNTRPVSDAINDNLLNVATVDPWRNGLTGLGTFRFKDWDRFISYPFSDVLRPLRYVSWGKKEDYIFATLHRTDPITIGHGQLMRRYMPNVDIDESNIFAEADAYYHFGGVELMVGPLPIPRLVGGLLFIKPLGLFLDDYISRSLSFGISYVTDLNVPTALTSSFDSNLRRQQFPIEDGRFVYQNRDSILGYQVHGGGIDAEVKLVKWRFIDVKVYADYSHLLFPGVPEQDVAPFMGGGGTVGTLVRLSFGSKPVEGDLEDQSEEVRQGLEPVPRKAVHAFRFRLEGRIFSPQYLPSYFNPLYEADKFQFGFATTPENMRANLPTKLAYLASQKNDPYRAGFYLEGSYTLTDWFAATFVYEDAAKLWGELATVPSARNVILHIETQGLGMLQFFATYHYRNFEFQDWTRLLNIGSENELIYMGGRLSLYFFSINLGVQRGLRVEFLDDDIPSIREATPGGKVLPHSSVGLQNQWAFALDIELGWNW